MPLKRYLLVCSALIFLMLMSIMAATTLVSPDGSPTIWEGVLIASVGSALGTFVQVLPVAALTTPVAKRTSFWAYRWSNSFFIFAPAVCVFIGLPLIWRLDLG